MEERETKNSKTIFAKKNIEQEGSCSLTPNYTTEYNANQKQYAVLAQRQIHRSTEQQEKSNNGSHATMVN